MAAAALSKRTWDLYSTSRTERKHLYLNIRVLSIIRLITMTGLFTTTEKKTIAIDGLTLRKIMPMAIHFK